MTWRQVVALVVIAVALLSIAVLAHVQRGEPCRPEGSVRCFR